MRLGFLGRGDVLTETASRGPASVRGSTTPSNADFHMIRAPSSPHVGSASHNQRGPNSGPLHPPPGASPSRMGPNSGAQGAPAAGKYLDLISEAIDC